MEDQIYKELELKYTSWSEDGENLPQPNINEVQEAA